mmetsp:Transcript_12397/g.49738  ORF Transcript_12397/g.49738 Transcript_12397/m.49738 type:complete len:86 (+) Transcript_12397:714-971(+)
MNAMTEDCKFLQASLFGRFIYGTNQFRNSRLKLIPNVALVVFILLHQCSIVSRNDSSQGPWVVQRAVGTKPLIVGRALKVNANNF